MDAITEPTEAHLKAADAVLVQFPASTSDMALAVARALADAEACGRLRIGGNAPPPDLGGLDSGEIYANGALIAGARQLLDSLEEILNYRGGADSALNDEYVMQRAHEAVRAARGQL